MPPHRLGSTAVLVAGLAIALGSASACRAIAGYDPASRDSEAGVDRDAAAVEASALDLERDLLLSSDATVVPT